MTEAMLVRARIKPGKADRLRAWYEELQERESEVVETLQHEGVYTETAFIQSVNGAAYLYGYMEAADLQEADETGDEEVYEIDSEHHNGDSPANCIQIQSDSDSVVATSQVVSFRTVTSSRPNT
jgi:hypothetical protein